MKIRFVIVSLVVAAMFVSAGRAFAQQNRWGAAGLIAHWKKMDANGDGKIAKAEATGLMKTYFDRNDTNSDGELDRAELTDLVKRLLQRQLANRPNPQGNQGPKNIPDNVKVLPDIAYREGDSKAWRRAATGYRLHSRRWMAVGRQTVGSILRQCGAVRTKGICLHHDQLPPAGRGAIPRMHRRLQVCRPLVPRQR